MDDSLLLSGHEGLPVCGSCARAFDTNATAKLVVRNLPPSWKNDELRFNFEKYGIINRVNVPTKSKLVGYIDYSEIGHAAMARYHMNGRVVEGHKLKVEYWVDKPQSSRPRNKPRSPPLYSSVESDTPPDERSPASSLGLSPSSSLNSQDPQVNTFVPSPTPWPRSPASYYNQHNEAPASQMQHPWATSNQQPYFQSNVSQVLSVYVKNVPFTALASEIEEVFKKFGKIRPNGVAIRTRKDINVCYAFVEYEDITGVNNAIKASTVEIAGQQVFIEGRRANRVNAYQSGRGRGRGRGHQTDGTGRFGGRNYSNRGNDYDCQARTYFYSHP